MKNEDAALNNGLSVVLPTTPFGAVHIKHEDYATPDVRVCVKHSVEY